MVEYLAFVLGPLLGLIVGPLALVVLVVLALLKRRMWPVWMGVTLMGVLALSTWAYWRSFWSSFEYALRDRDTPFEVQLVEYVALVGAVLACVGLLISVVIAAGSRPGPSRSTRTL